jgi:tetratricopeptide (TPR) repeat protein
VVVTPTDPFTAQSEIATRVVSEIGIAVGVRARAALATAPTANAEAYELYLRARALRDPSRPGGGGFDVDEAARLLERATRLDPSFGLAFAELASVEQVREQAGDTTATPRLEAAIRAALALDPELPEAHLVMALHRGRHESRYADALAAAARASARKPGDAEMLRALAEFQVIAGRVDEGFANFERAVTLDPRNWLANAGAARHAWQFRRLDDVERHARRLTALAPDYGSGPFYAMVTALARGDTAAARRIRVAGALARGEPQRSWVLFWVLPRSLARFPGGPPGAEDPDLAPVAPGGTLAYYATLGAWARETGQPARARAWFDSAVAVVGAPQYALAGRRFDVVYRSGMRAVALAGAGRAAEARRTIAYADSIERLNGVPNEPWSAMGQDYLAYAELLLGDRDAALARLERVLVLPTGRTPAMLRTMWPYTSLHGDPRFRRLAEIHP